MSSQTKEPLSVDHFRQILTNETDNLNRQCERWSRILESTSGAGDNNNHSPTSAPPPPSSDYQATDLSDEETLGAIRSTIGQAKLLMSQRFKQFSKLIDDCENNTGALPTRLDDLLGFWEMINYQVDDVRKKFNLLESKFHQ